MRNSADEKIKLKAYYMISLHSFCLEIKDYSEKLKSFYHSAFREERVVNAETERHEFCSELDRNQDLLEKATEQLKNLGVDVTKYTEELKHFLRSLKLKDLKKQDRSTKMSYCVGSYGHAQGFLENVRIEFNMFEEINSAVFAKLSLKKLKEICEDTDGLKIIDSVKSHLFYIITILKKYKNSSKISGGVDLPSKNNIEDLTEKESTLTKEILVLLEEFKNIEKINLFEDTSDKDCNYLQEKRNYIRKCLLDTIKACEDLIIKHCPADVQSLTSAFSGFKMPKFQFKSGLYQKLSALTAPKSGRELRNPEILVSEFSALNSPKSGRELRDPELLVVPEFSAVSVETVEKPWYRRVSDWIEEHVPFLGKFFNKVLDGLFGKIAQNEPNVGENSEKEPSSEVVKDTDNIKLSVGRNPEEKDNNLDQRQKH